VPIDFSMPALESFVQRASQLPRRGDRHYEPESNPVIHRIRVGDRMYSPLGPS
jgi:hypothetical protein